MPPSVSPKIAPPAPAAPGATAALRDGWRQRSTSILIALIVMMSAVAALRLFNEGNHLLFGTGWRSAVDLKYRWQETHAWFNGENIYTRWGDAVYPPATYVLLRPVIGYVSLPAARIVWAVVLSIGTLWLAIIGVRELRGRPWLEIIAMLLLPFAIYATAATFSTGQLVAVLLPLVIGGILLIARPRAAWWQQLLGAAGVTVALAKPTLALPFLPIVLFVPRSWWPAIFVAVLYALLTAVGFSYQHDAPLLLMRQWMGNAGQRMHEDYANLHSWLAAIGRENLASVASPLIGIALAGWVWVHRRVDVWILIGAASLVARLWTYHRIYDDMLCLPAIIALLHLARRNDDAQAAVMAAIIALAALAPSNRLNYPGPAGAISRLGEAFVWVLGLIFLASRAAGERRSAVTRHE